MTDGLENQRHRQDLVGAARQTRRCGAADRQIRIRARSVLRSKPSVGQASSTIPVKRLSTSSSGTVAAADGRIVDGGAAACATPDEHDEMIVVPVQNAGQAKPPQIAASRPSPRGSTA